MLQRRFWVVVGLVGTFAMPWRATDSGLQALDPELPAALDHVPVRDTGDPRGISTFERLLEQWSRPAVAGASGGSQSVHQDSVANDSSLRER